MIKEKGVFELVDAVTELMKKGANIELSIAGDGADFEFLKDKTKDLSYIKILGDVQGHEKISLFKESHFYVLPSYTEGLPISVLEAMLFGLPIITTNVGGLKYFIEEEKMGYLVDVKSKNSLVEKIELLIENPEKMRKMSKYNFNYAQKELSNDVMAKRLYVHFKELI
jgi:glycosyltransferase involved in cell wall biosynthesis